MSVAPAGATHKHDCYGTVTYWKRGTLTLRNFSLVDPRPFPSHYDVRCWFYFDLGKWVADREACSRHFVEV